MLWIIVVVVAADTNLFIRIQVVLCYMQSSTSSQQFWVIHTMPVEVYVSLTNLLQSSSLTTSAVIIVICFAVCTDTPCILTDHSGLVLSPGNQYKICSPHCIFLCNFLNSQASQIWHDFIRLWKILFIMKKREYLNVNWVKWTTYVIGMHSSLSCNPCLLLKRNSIPCLPIMILLQP